MTILLTPLPHMVFLTSKTITVPSVVKRHSRRYFSQAAVSLCIYLLINLSLQLVLPHLTSDDQWSRTAHSAVAQFNNLSSTPGIVFVGSSVMGRPIWWVDHAHYKIAPYPNHRRMKWMPNELAKTGLGDVQAFNFSLDAAMVSDVYLACDKVLKNNRIPELVVYGINRRDVLGCLFLSERTTPAFRLFFEPSDCRELSHLYSASVKERFELFLGELLPVYRYRQLFQDHTIKELGLIRNFFPSLSLDQTVSTSEKKTRQNQNSGSESSSSSPIRAIGNFTTYTMDKTRLKNKEVLLKMLAQLLAKRHSHLLIVNMPLKADYSGAAERACSDYQETLNACAKLPNTFLMDLDGANQGFDNDCFEDWFHLNARGGEKLLTFLVDWLKHHKTLLSADLGQG